MNRPLISIVTISRNDLPGLRQTRKSVASQSYPSVEHVVVDAASTDGTREWLERESRIRWVSEADGGRYDGMNKGIALSEGQLVWFLHAGDRLVDSDCVEHVVQSWERCAWLWAYGGARLVDENGKLRGVNLPIPFSLKKLALGVAVIPHQAACFEKQLICELGGYDVGFGLAADQLLMLQAATVSVPHVISKFLCDFDLSGAGSTRSPSRHFLDARRARQVTGLTVGRNRPLDLLLTFGLTGAESARRLIGRWFAE